MNKTFKKKGKLSFLEAYRSRNYLETINDMYGKVRLIKARPQGAKISFSNQTPETFDLAGYEALEFIPLGEATSFKAV